MSRTSIHFIRRRLAKDGELRARVAADTGIPLQTIRNFALGITRHPRYDTFAPIADWFGRGGR